MKMNRILIKNEIGVYVFQHTGNNKTSMMLLFCSYTIQLIPT